MTPLRIEAPAKLNVGLRVVGRRDDGYHLVESEVVTVELADRLLLLPRSSGLRVDGAVAGVPLDGTNLAWRGLLAGFGEEPPLVCLALEKGIPVAAGMGGGSSDAAAAWRLARASLGIEQPPGYVELAALASIGADVPFFAAAVPAARIGGIGERVEPVAAQVRDVVLVHPPFGLSTREVFAELRAVDWGSEDNDLLGPALRLRPELADLVAIVRGLGAEPRMTGSGPTLFALTDDGERASSLAAGLGVALHGTGARVTLTRTRDAAPEPRRADGDLDHITEESHA